MNKNMALISSCLLVFSTQLLADRPSMGERSPEPAMAEPAVTEPAMQSPAAASTESPKPETMAEPAVAEPAMTESAMQSPATPDTETMATETMDTETMATETMDTETLSPLEAATASANPKPQPESAATDKLPSASAAQPEQSSQQTGDVLELQSGETLPVQVLDFPRRGMNMDKVKNELGEPLEISLPIGEPPITSWSYSDRTVYFEHSKVIHAVSSR